MAHYLDPKNDLTFQRVFDDHKYLCMSLINRMLPPAKPIMEIEYQTNKPVSEITYVLCNTIVDNRCTDSDGCQFLVEMQLFWNESFRRRVLLNASKAYVMQLVATGHAPSLHLPVYALNPVNDTFESSPEMKDVYFHLKPT
jgi:predicted transposase/invertase (TIGR01784 family)